MRGLVPFSLLLGACAANLPFDERVLLEVRSAYERRAMEENGLCLTPEMRAITAVRELESTAGKRVLEVRYHYEDPSYGAEAPALFPRCSGFSTRIFVLDAQSGEVLAMSGPKRKRRDFSLR